MFCWHKWSPWLTVRSGIQKWLHEDNSYAFAERVVVQERRCEKCGKVQQHTSKTDVT